MHFVRTPPIVRTPSMLFALCISLNSVTAVSADMSANEKQNEPPLEAHQIEAHKMGDLTITGGHDEILVTPGSAHLVDEVALEKFEYTDIHQILSSVPGVYLRTEDGFGLRPNVGIRGAAAERSQKITLMEDGILIKPAPYSAPSAYYFPSVSRMNGVEVFKGPVAIQYGPNSVGGALNLITPGIPNTPDPSGLLELGLGSDLYRRANALIGASQPLANNEWRLGWLASAYHLASDGFKRLASGDDTGFTRNDVMLKVGLETTPLAPRYQRFELKLGYADERSDETYLGLTDDDFNRDPYQRYAASQLDRMEWDHQLLHLTHTFEINPDTELTTRVYHNQFTRAWNKFEDFHTGATLLESAAFSVEDVLANPNGLGEQRYYNILTGNVDADGSDRQKIDVTNNDRDYRSQGIAWTLTHLANIGAVQHELKLGFRAHHDEVSREHTVKAYTMQDSQLQFDGEARDPLLLNKDESDALAAYAHNQMQWDQWHLTVGIRGERIKNQTRNALLPERNRNNTQSILLPGLGVHYQWHDNLGLLAGVYKGFSPAPPSGGSNAEPEETINWEAGFRYHEQARHVEMIGFFSDYSNLTDICGFSDTGCQQGEGFNAGAVEIAGIEFSASERINWSSWQIPLALNYTYTESAFQTSFLSNFSQWGNVSKGDELPYIPEHQLHLNSGFGNAIWEVNLGITYTGEMRETPGRGSANEATFVEASTRVDMGISYWLSDALRLQANIDNAFDDNSLVSRRPFGARPNKPRTVIGSIQFTF